jgi:hypothetical protein
MQCARAIELIPFMNVQNALKRLREKISYIGVSSSALHHTMCSHSPCTTYNTYNSDELAKVLRSASRETLQAAM